MALFIRYIGHRNSENSLTEDAFSQPNPPTAGHYAATTYSTTLAAQTNTSGILGGSVAFTRPDVGSGFNGGPYLVASAVPTTALGLSCLPLGLVINDAVGNAFENTPGVASGKGPYTSGLGTMVVDLYETQGITAAPGTMSNGVAVTTGSTIPYTIGLLLYASVNGYLTPLAADSYEVVSGHATATVIGVVTEAPTSISAQMKLDQRV